MSTDLVRLAHAADYAARQHIGQRRKGVRAEPYINHLTEVAALLAEATDGQDVVLLMGGLLHDTLEDTDATYDDLLERFGPEVAALVARGWTNAQIAAELVIAERTADRHVENILHKLDFRSRAQIAAWAVDRGLLGDAPDRVSAG